jgi:hypothetical protein
MEAPSFQVTDARELQRITRESCMYEAAPLGEVQSNLND